MSLARIGRLGAGPSTDFPPTELRAASRLAAWRRRARAGIAGLAALLAATPAGAQAPADPRPPRYEVGGGGLRAGGYSLGTSEATLTPNQPGPPFVLFRVSSEMEPAVGLETRIGYHLSRRITVEGGLQFSRPQVATSVGDDAEDAAPLVARERLSQYVIEGGVRVAVMRARFGRAAPFVTGGAGYLRQLHEGNTLVETGVVGYLGGGLLAPLVTRPRGFPRDLGLRADLRIYVRDSGFDFEENRRRTFGTAGASLFVSF
jgi:hypothetical protein